MKTKREPLIPWLATTVAPSLIVCGSVVMAVAGEPLGTVPPGAFVLDQGWQMQSSALIGDEGAELSMPGQLSGTWYKTEVPTTVLSALIRHGVYPDPYVGTNNMMIPDAHDVHNKRFNLARFSHLPDKSNPWMKPWWFCREFQVPRDYRGKVIWLNLDGINYRADVWLNGQQIGHAKDIAGMFKRYRFDVTRQIQPGTTNALANPVPRTIPFGGGSMVNFAASRRSHTRLTSATSLHLPGAG